MTTYSYPNHQPSSIDFQILSNAAAARVSPFSDYIQTVDREGERWIARVAYAELFGDRRAELKAFMAKLNGQQHRFTMRDFGHAQRGAGGGSPLVAGASQTGKTLNIDGAASSVTNWLRAGDQISISSRMYQLDEDVNTSGGGAATLTLSPRIFFPYADNAPIEIVTPVETFILADGTYSFNTTRNMISTLSFVAFGVRNES